MLRFGLGTLPNLCYGLRFGLSQSDSPGEIAVGFGVPRGLALEVCILILGQAQDYRLYRVLKRHSEKPELESKSNQQNLRMLGRNTNPELTSRFPCPTARLFPALRTPGFQKRHTDYGENW